MIYPFFEEGGRLTIHHVHYVAEGERIESLPLEEPRRVDQAPVRNRLRGLTAGSACIVNAAVGADLDAALTRLWILAAGRGESPPVWQ